MKQLLLMFFVFFLVSISYAQELNVKSFKINETDISARTENRVDINGNKCALIIVGIALQNVEFDGNVVDVVNKTGEYWVYMAEGSKRLKIKHPRFVPCVIDFSKYGIKKLAKETTYSLVVLSSSPVNNEVDGNFLVMKIDIKTASVYIDGKLQTINNSGEVKAFLQNGLHECRIEARGYVTETKTIRMNGERISFDIEMRSTNAIVEIKCKTKETSIYIDETLVGREFWKGEIFSGNHLIEIKKTGYQDYKQTISVNDFEKKTLTIPALIPRLGSIIVDFSPVDADVYVDEKLVGKTPIAISQVLIGKHSIRISKQGYSDFKSVTTVNENMQTDIKGELVSIDIVQQKKKIEKLYTDANKALERKEYTLAIKLFKNAVELGDKESEYELGNIYWNGLGVSVNNNEAIKWYRLAGGKGVLKAQLKLGTIFLRGDGVNKNEDEALKWFTKAAEQGSGDAMYSIGHIYYSRIKESVNRVEEKINHDLAESWYIKSVDKGSINAMLDLGKLYTKSIYREIDKGIKYIEMAIEKGDVTAMFYLGLIYEESHDYAKAKKWFEEAINKGHVGALTKLGWLYERGRGVPENNEKAFLLYSEAVEKGDINALERLGCFYLNGICCQRNIEKAIEFFNKGFEHGNTDCARHLGNYYYSCQEYGKAKTYYFKAYEFDKEHDYLYRNLYKSNKAKYLEIYVNNNSSLSIEEKFKYGKNALIDKCYYEAELLITDCAEQGDAEAQYILGESISMQGKNGTEWLLKAAQQNNLKAMESLFCCRSDYLGEKERKKWLDKMIAMNPKDPEIQVFLYSWANDLNWLLKALEQEDEYALNFVTENIDFICQDHKNFNVEKWLKLAANKGNSQACAFLAIAYYNGYLFDLDTYGFEVKIDKDFVNAYKYAKKAIEEGYNGGDPSLENLYFIIGDSYLYGYGVEKNRKEALSNYQKSGSFYYELGLDHMVEEDEKEKEQSMTDINPSNDIIVNENSDNYESKKLSIREINNPIVANLVNNMVFVKGGTFRMGRKLPKEMPVNMVTVNDFYIGKYELTYKEWEAIMGKDNIPKDTVINKERLLKPDYLIVKDDNYPVAIYNYYYYNELKKFIENLNVITGMKFRLPTSAEWEYAARGGLKTHNYLYAGSNNLDEVGWHWHNSDDFPKNSTFKLLMTHMVGQKKPNELGLYDMSGNLSEICTNEINNEDNSTEIQLIERGGNMDSKEEWCNVYYSSDITNSNLSRIGVRLVLSVE